MLLEKKSQTNRALLWWKPALKGKTYQRNEKVWKRFDTCTSARKFLNGKEKKKEIRNVRGWLEPKLPPDMRYVTLPTAWAT